MLEIWSNCNSMMSLSNHVLVWCNRRKEDNTIGWILIMQGSWKLDVGIAISCPMISSRTTSDEMGHNP